MSVPCASPSQVRALQAARRAAGIGDEDWRARLARDAGVSSTKALTAVQAGRLLDDLRPAADSAAARMAGPYAQKVRALWISAYWLGIVDDRRDAAILAFVRRQTGLDAVTWLRAHGDAQRVIEALKAWIAREGGVDWAVWSDPKTAVAVAILDRLIAAGAWVPDRSIGSLGQIEAFGLAMRVGPVGRIATWGPAAWDVVIAAMGRKLRAARKAGGRAAG